MEATGTYTGYKLKSMELPDLRNFLQGEGFTLSGIWRASLSSYNVLDGSVPCGQLYTSGEELGLNVRNGTRLHEAVLRYHEPHAAILSPDADRV